MPLHIWCCNYVYVLGCTIRGIASPARYPFLKRMNYFKFKYQCLYDLTLPFPSQQLNRPSPTQSLFLYVASHPPPHLPSSPSWIPCNHLSSHRMVLHMASSTRGPVVRTWTTSSNCIRMSAPMMFWMCTDSSGVRTIVLPSWGD